jgi:hypothetical protein
MATQEHPRIVSQAEFDRLTRSWRKAKRDKKARARGVAPRTMPWEFPTSGREIPTATETNRRRHLPRPDDGDHHVAGYDPPRWAAI